MEGHPYQIIIPTGFILGMASGFILHRSDFCIAGMFRDIFLFKNSKKIKSLFLLVIVSMVLFELSRLFGFLPLYPFPLLGFPSIANLVGGFLFGFGMVLAGGCVVGILYKIGSGSIISLIAFIGFIIGSALYAEVHPLWVNFIRQSTIFPGKITISQIIGLPPTFFVIFFLIPAVYFLYRWNKKGDFFESTVPEGYIKPSLAAILLAIIGLLSYIIIGMPLGITTTYSKIAGFIEKLLLPAHFETLDFYRLVSLKYNYPYSGIMLSGGPGPVFDAIAAIQLPVIIGIVFGSFISALKLREFNIYIKLPLRQYVSALIGGIIVGLASRLTPACNVWHIFGGLPIFAMQSILFVIALLPGAWLGTIALKRFIFR